MFLLSGDKDYRDNKPVPIKDIKWHPAVFFQVLIKTITRIFTETASEKALKSVNLPSLKVAKVYRRLCGREAGGGI